jgi:hypothetical protein
MPKYKNPPIWAKFGFQVDYDAANWYPNFTGMLSTMSRCADYYRNFQNSHRYHGDHKKNMTNFKVLDETLQKFCLTCVHIILRHRNFRMVAVATKHVKSARNWMKLNRNVVWHVYKWFWGLEISKCLPLPWKPQIHPI